MTRESHPASRSSVTSNTCAKSGHVYSFLRLGSNISGGHSSAGDRVRENSPPPSCVRALGVQIGSGSFFHTHKMSVSWDKKALGL